MNLISLLNLIFIFDIVKEKKKKKKKKKKKRHQTRTVYSRRTRLGTEKN